MIEWLTPVGTFLGGAGQAAQGIQGIMPDSGDGYRGGATRRMLSDQLKYQGMLQGQTWRNQMWLAKQQGIHKLVAAGLNPAMGGGWQSIMGSKKSGDWSDLGQGLERMSKVGMSEVQKAQLENLKAETDLRNAEAERIRADMPAHQDPTAVHVENLPPPKNPAYQGENALEKVYFHQKINGERELEFLPSQDAQDYLSESWWDNLKYRVKKEWQGYGLSARRMKPQTVQMIRNFLDELEMIYPPRAGWNYAWSFKAGRPIEIKKNKYGKGAKLFDTKYLKERRYTGFDAIKNR